MIVFCQPLFYLKSNKIRAEYIKLILQIGNIITEIIYELESMCALPLQTKHHGRQIFPGSTRAKTMSV